jgi:hypothetical protein
MAAWALPAARKEVATDAKAADFTSASCKRSRQFVRQTVTYKDKLLFYNFCN